MGRVRKPVHPGGVREILGFESDHAARATGTLAVGVHEADLVLPVPAP